MSSYRVAILYRGFLSSVHVVVFVNVNNQLRLLDDNK